MKINRSFISCL